MQNQLKGKDYPASGSDVNAYKKNIKDTVNDYIGFVIFDSNFEGGAGLSDLFLGGLEWKQFEGVFGKVERVGEDMGGMIMEFVGKKWTVERNGIMGVVKKNIGKDSYPDKTELGSVKSGLRREFKKFYGG